MKYLLIFIFLTTAVAMGQTEYVYVGAERPIDFSQVNDSLAYVSGHWVSSDLAGQSTSQISCVRTNMTCADAHAEIISIGKAFTLSGGEDEYRVERWNSREIVASAVGGICRVRNTIKFDRTQKRVYSMQTLSEPLNDLPADEQKICKIQMQSELKDGTTFQAKQQK